MDVTAKWLDTRSRNPLISLRMNLVAFSKRLSPKQDLTSVKHFARVRH